MKKNIDYLYIKKAISIDVIATILVTLSGILLIPYAIKTLGAEEYGLWIGVSSVVIIFGLFDLGLDQYLISLVAGKELKSKNIIVGEIVGALVLKILIMFFIIIIAIMFYYNINLIIELKSEFKSSALEVYFYCVLNLCLNMGLSLIQSIYFGLGKVVKVNLITASTALTTNILTCCLLSFDVGMLSFPYAQIVASTFSILIYVLLVPGIQWKKIVCVDKIIFTKKMIGFSFSFQMLKWAFIARNHFINILINNICGASYVAAYMIANKLPQILLMTSTKITTPFLPSFGKKLVGDNINGVRADFIKINHHLMGLMMFGAIGIIFTTKEFLRIWIDAEYSQSLSLTIVTVVSVLVLSAAALPTIFILASGDFRKSPMFACLELVVALCLGTLLGNYFGINGVLIGFLTGIVISTIYVNYIVFDRLKIKLGLFIRETFIKPFFKNIPIILYFFIVINYPMYIGIKELIAIGFFSIVLYILINYMFGTSGNEV